MMCVWSYIRCCLYDSAVVVCCVLFDIFIIHVISISAFTPTCMHAIFLHVLYILTPDLPLFNTRHVSFSYPNSTERVLDDVSFTISPGQNVAIVGPSGSGMSTTENIYLCLVCVYYTVYMLCLIYMLCYYAYIPDYIHCWCAYILLIPIHSSYNIYSYVIYRQVNTNAPVNPHVRCHLRTRTHRQYRHPRRYRKLPPEPHLRSTTGYLPIR